MVRRLAAFFMAFLLCLSMAVPSFASVATSSNAQRLQVSALNSVDNGVSVASDLYDTFEIGYRGYEGVQVNIYTESAGWYTPTTLSTDNGQS